MIKGSRKRIPHKEFSDDDKNYFENHFSALTNIPPLEVNNEYLDLPQVKGIQASTSFTLHTFTKYSLNCDNSIPEVLANNIANYFQDCTQTGFPPVLECIASMIGCKTATLTTMTNPNNPIHAIVMRAKEIIHQNDIQLAMTGVMLSSLYQFRSSSLQGLHKNVNITQNLTLGDENGSETLKSIVGAIELDDDDYIEID